MADAAEQQAVQRVSSAELYNYFRDYDRTTGRYIESDPIGLAGGMNPYLYAEGNPLTFIDPSGLAGFKDSLRAVLLAIMQIASGDPELGPRPPDLPPKQPPGIERPLKDPPEKPKGPKSPGKGRALGIPFVVWEILQELCRHGAHSGIGCIAGDKRSLDTIC